MNCLAQCLLHVFGNDSDNGSNSVMVVVIVVIIKMDIINNNINST